MTDLIIRRLVKDNSNSHIGGFSMNMQGPLPINYFINNFPNFG
jgi:hypothetical protein